MAEFYESLAKVPLHFATLKVRNISRYIFKVDVLYCVIKYRGLVKTKACRMCDILKFTQNSSIVLIPYLHIYSHQCFVTTLLTSYCVYAWFNMGRITKDDRCLIKTIKTKHYAS